MQSRQARSDPLHGISIPNSSSAWILLWLFLHLHLLVFFFDNALTLLMELKWVMLNKHQKWFHSSRVKSPFVSMSASWFLVSMYLMWILGVQIDSIIQPIKSNSVGSGNISHCRTSPLYDHLDHCFVVFKDVQQNFLTRRIRVWGNKINQSFQEFSFALEM